MFATVNPSNMIFTILSFCALHVAGIPSDGEIALLTAELRNAYDTVSIGGESLFFKPLAGSVLRLIFHDCGGPPEGNTPGIISKCDGCIDLDFFDNFNLEERAVEPLDDIYIGSLNNWDQKMSRADFWAFAANEAIRYTRESVFDGATLPNIPDFFGRIDCASSPDVNGSITQSKPFPEGIFGWNETFTWMNRELNVTAEETVALIGAHTIGRNHVNDLGFTGPWVPSWGEFNNDYYVRMRTSLSQSIASNGMMEWGSGFTMLNVDIGLFRDLDDHDSIGRVSCGFNASTCPLNPEVSGVVDTFATNPQAWLNAFVSGYIKMITLGYDVETELVDQATVTNDPAIIQTIQPTPGPTFGFASEIELTPSITGEASASVRLTSALDGSFVPDFSVTFLIISNDCINPTLSVTYEAIDFSDFTSDETFDVFDDDGSFITNCAGGGQCAGQQICLNSAFVLSTDIIPANSSYTIDIVTGSGFHRLCGNTLSFDATVTLHCGATQAPTNEPTQPTQGPTNNPTAQSQAPTNAPIQLVFVELEPSNTSEETTATGTIQSTNSGTNVGDWDIEFSIISNDCIDPRISVQFEEIDFSSTLSEFFDVFDNNQSLITRCTGNQDQNCNVWETCIPFTALDIDQIDADTIYRITIETGSGFNPLCSISHPFSLHVNVTLACGDTQAPTESPTTEPTTPSQPPTELPTIEPTTPAPTDGPLTVELEPSSISTVEVSGGGTIQSTNSNVNEFIDITFSIISNDCINPRLSVQFEEIDFSSPSNEFFDVFDMNGSIITRCTGNQDRNCNIWETCIDRTPLDIDRIDADTTYTVTIETGTGFNVLCSGSHSLSFRANVTLTCGNSSPVLPSNNPTTEPTQEPTLSCSDCSLDDFLENFCESQIGSNIHNIAVNQEKMDNSGDGSGTETDSFMARLDQMESTMNSNLIFMMIGFTLITVLIWIGIIFVYHKFYYKNSEESKHNQVPTMELDEDESKEEEVEELTTTS